MAKKPTFRELYGRWSQEKTVANRRQQEQISNREQEALGIIESIEADGTALSDDQKAEILNQFTRTGKLNFSMPEAPVLPEETPVATGPGIDTATYVPTSETRATTSQAIFDNIPTTAADLGGDFGANLRANAREGLAGLMTGVAPIVNMTINSPANVALANKLGIVLPQLRSPKAIRDAANNLRREARDIRTLEISERGRMGMEVLNDAEGFVDTSKALLTNPTILSDQAGAQTGTLIAAAPGAIAGPQGLIATQAISAGGMSGEEAYQNVLDKGGTEEEAESARNVAASLSAGINFAGQRLIPKGGALEELITGQVSKQVSRSTARAVAAPLAGEAAAEALTETLDQASVNFASGDPIEQGLGKAAAMGTFLGTAMGAGPATADGVQSVRNRRERAAETERNILSNQPVLPDGAFVPDNTGLEGVREAGQARREAQAETVDRDLYYAQEDLRRQAERDAAFDAAEAAQAAQRELEQEAGFQTIERDAGKPTSRVERYADVVERVPVNPAQEVTPDQVVQQRADAVRQAAEAARVKEINDVARRRESVSKAAAKKAEADKKKMAGATRAQRNAAIDKLMADNPNATDAEIADMLPDAVKGVVGTEAVTPKAVPAKKPVKAEPKPMPAAKPAAKTAEGVRFDSIAEEAAKKLGLGMAAKGEAKGGNFRAKAASIAKALANNNSRQAAAVEDLVRQGKLVIAPNAKDVGRTDEGRVGEYDIADGKMYVYADRLSDNPVADIIEAASHESGHAGTFNQREGRSRTMQALVGNDKFIEAADKIRKSNHKFAVDAKAKAEADSKARGDTTFEDAELVGYFIGNVAESRNTALGTVGGVVRDLITGAKDVVRTKLGRDLDVNIGDLNTAASRVMEEVARTDTTGTEGGETLGMIYPKTAKGYEQALKDGRVYTSSAGNEQFVLSDADAEMKPDAAAKLAAGTTMRLEEVMDHPVLFDNMPAARDILITKSGGFGAGGMAQYTPGTDVIEVSQQLVDGKAPATLRDAILHETQHWVQDMSEAREGFITTKDRPKAEMDAVTRFEAATKANDKAARAVLDEARNLVQGLTPTEKRAAMNIVTDQNLPIHKRASELIDMVDNTADSNGVVEAFQSSLDEYRDAVKGYNAADRMKRARYLRNPTEAEAFFTQANTRTAQEDLPVNPETDPDYGTEVMATMGNRNTLGMAAKTPAKGALRNKNKVLTALVSNLRNDKGLGKHVRNEVELAKAAPAEFEAKANRAVGRYDRATEKMAKDQGVTVKSINDSIRDDLEAIADMKGTPSEYLAAFHDVTKKYGDAGKALNDLRSQVDGLSEELLRTYMDSGVKLTPSEVTDLKKVVANLGRYVHRFYAAHQGRGLGKQYSAAVQKAVDKANVKGETSLTPAQKELLDRYNNAAKVVLDGVMIPDEAGMADLDANSLDYLYHTWVTRNDDGISRDQKEAELAALREELGPEDIDAKAEAATQALLHGTEEAAASRYYRGNKVDRTIMQQRKKVPKEIRELMGEVNDPAAALLVTVSKQAEYVARTKMLMALKDVADPNDLQPPGNEGSRIVRENNMKPLEGESYGPLNGWYASPSMQAMIGDTRESLQNFVDAAAYNNEQHAGAVEAAGRAALRLWMKGASAAKAINIVGNVFRYPLNFAGSFGMLGLNGNLNVKSWATGLGDASNIIRYAHSPENGLSKTAANAVKYRVVDSATVGDLKLLDQGKVEQVVKEMAGKKPGAALRALTKAGLAGRESYAMMDVWSKIANFHAEANFLRDLYEAEGIKKTDDEIYREASDIANQTNMSYSRTMPLLKSIERGGITQYGPYLYEAHRVVLSNLAMGAGELYRAKNMTNPKAQALLAARGTARMLGTAATLTALGKITQWAAQMWGDDEEDKRALLPEYARDMDFVNLGTDSEGKPVLYAISNVDPIGPITDLYRAARNGDAPFEQAWAKFKDNYIGPALGPALWNAVMISANQPKLATQKNQRKPLVQEWAPAGWNWVAGKFDNANEARAWANLIETRFVPGTARAWTTRNPTVAEPVSDSLSDTASATMYNIARGLGAKGIKYDPVVGARNAGYEYKDAIDSMRTNLKSYIENTDTPSAEELTSRLLDMRIEERKVWDQLARVQRGMRSVGVEDTTSAMKEAGVPKKILAQLDEGVFVSDIINQDSITKAAQKEMLNKPKEEQDKIAAKWENAWEILQELGGQ